MYLVLFTNNTKLCNIVIDKGNKYFVSILMHAKQKRRVAALLFLCYVLVTVWGGNTYSIQ